MASTRERRILVDVIGRFDAIDRAAGEVDDRLRAAELTRPLAERSRVPRDVPPWAAAARRTAREDYDGAAARGKMRGER